MASLGHTGRRVVLDYTLNTQTLTKTHEQTKKVLSKFMILCLTAFIAILGHMQPMSLGLDTPAWINFAWKKSAFGFSSICFPPDFPFPFPYVLTNCLKGKTFLPLLLRSITVGEVTFLCAIVRAWEVVGDMERDWQKFLFIGWEIA